MRRLGTASRKYVFTPALLEELRLAYCGKKPAITAALDRLTRQTGWPRWAFKNEAIRRGWSTWDHRRGWSPEETEQLRELLGRVSIQRVARTLNRTVLSVQSRAGRLDISRRPQEGYNMTDLQLAFGESAHKVRTWMARGLFGKARSNCGQRVTESAVRNFIRVHSAEYDLRRVDQAWYKGLAFSGDLS